MNNQSITNQSMSISIPIFIATSPIYSYIPLMARQKSFQLPNAEKIELKKFSCSSENKKYLTAHINTTKTVVYFDKENGLQTRTTEHRQLTTFCRNGECSSSYKSFVVGSSVVLRLNFCAKNSPLPQTPKSWPKQLKHTEKL